MKYNHLDQLIEAVKTKYTLDDLSDHHGVSAIIYDENGNKILVQLHVKFNFWTIPVGKVDQGQKVIDGLKMELKEECGIVPTNFKKIASFTKYYTRDGKKVKVIQHLFEVNKYSGTVKNMEPQKHKKQLFMSIEEIKKLNYISDATKEALKYLE